MITDKVSIIKIAVKNGNTRIVSVKHAITAMVPPRASEPVSPMKYFAGGMLFHIKAPVAPTIVAQNVARMYKPWVYEIIPRLMNVNMLKPEANPSRPSVMFTAFDDAVINATKRGKYHNPISYWLLSRLIEL